MPSPFDFTINAVDPRQAAFGGLATGMKLKGARFAQEQAVAQAERQKQTDAAITTLSAKDNPTASDFVAVANLLPKAQADSIRASWELLNTEQQQSQLSFAGQVMAAFDTKPEIGIALLEERAAAERNSGNEDKAKAFETWAELAKVDPKLAKRNIGVMLSTVPGGDKVIDGIVELGEERRTREGGVSVSEVQRSDILPDGTVQLVRKDGTIEIVTASEANKEIVEQARKFGAKLQGLRSGERTAGSEAIKQSIEAFKGLAGIRKNIRNMKEGVRLLNEGAKTGAVEGRLPSIRASSVKLDNLQGRLGLDIIGAVTFGALSEKELEFAKDTALPKGLDEEELKKWFVEKSEAQEKMAANLEEAAIFLGEPGNTVADFLKIKKAEREDAESSDLPEGVTEEDIIETMRANNMTREQVLTRLAGG